jgi:hypothetical protein
MIELRMNISINDGEFIKSYDKTIQNRGYQYYEIDLSEYSIDTILRLQVVNNYITKSLTLCMIQIKETNNNKYWIFL